MNRLEVRAQFIKFGGLLLFFTDDDGDRMDYKETIAVVLEEYCVIEVDSLHQQRG